MRVVRFIWVTVFLGLGFVACSSGDNPYDGSVEFGGYRTYEECLSRRPDVVANESDSELDQACGGSGSVEEATKGPTKTTTTTKSATTTAEDLSDETPSASVDTSGSNPLGGDDPEDALMPNVICMNLQAAQDEIQDHGVFFSRSVDATGVDRSQIVDSNWVVVDQTPAPGTPIGEGEAVLFAVKYGEQSSVGSTC